MSSLGFSPLEKLKAVLIHVLHTHFFRTDSKSGCTRSMSYSPQSSTSMFEHCKRMQTFKTWETPRYVKVTDKGKSRNIYGSWNLCVDACWDARMNIGNVCCRLETRIHAMGVRFEVCGSDD